MTEGMTSAEIGQIITGAMGFFLLGFAGYGIANLRFKIQGTGFFVALTIVAAVWCFGYAFEKGQTIATGFMTAARIEYLGLAFLPSLWFLVAISWMEHPLARSTVLRVGVLGFGVLVLATVWTNESHHWYYATIVPTGRVGFARYTPGILYYPIFSVLASSFFISSALLFTRRKHLDSFRKKAASILAANGFPVVFSVAYQLGFRPGGLDLTVLSLIPALSFLSVGLFRHHFVRIVPIAREMVVESLENPVLVHDANGKLVDHNAAAGTDLSAFEKALGDHREPRGELRVSLDGDFRDFRFRRSPITGQGGQIHGTVTILTDVTEERRLLDELAHQATHDALTGVANRRHFESHALGEVTRAGRHGGTVSLVLFDLDRFKEINDQFGHQAGDKVLRSVVETISTRLRIYDLLARVGGEEFAVLMPQANPEVAREAAERWRAAIESVPQVLPGAVLTVTASFGVASLNDLPPSLPADPQIRLDTLMAMADRALYQAKAGGRNQVC